jgi:hypothetical protein
MGFNLASITRGAVQKPPRIVLYAPHGVGKTTFGACAPSPILLPFEDGVGRLDIPTFPLIKSWAETVEALNTLITEQHDFKTVVVDTLDWFEPMVWAEASSRNSWKDIEQPGFGKGYIAAADVWREFLEALNVLRDERGMQIILLAHSEVKRFDDPTTDGYDRYQIKLQKRAAEIVQEWGDAVLFANFKSYTTQSDAGFNKKTTRGVGTGERVMYTEERPSHYAKNRYQLPAEIPFSYADFDAAMNPAVQA